jgi:multidrug resistance efflux pump
MSCISFTLLAFVLCCGSAAGQAVDEKQPLPVDGRGTVVPEKRASITSLTAGRIAEVLVEEGQVVKKGQILFRLERTAAEGRVRRTETAVELAMARLKLVEAREGEEAVARAEVARFEGEAQLAEALLKRLKEAAVGGGVPVTEVAKAEQAHRIARASLDRARAALESLVKELAAQRAVARAEVGLARSKSDVARQALEATEIRAPLEGTILALHAEVGGYTNPAMAGLANAATLAEIASAAPLKVSAEIKESDLPRVKLGQKCEVFLDAYPKARLTGSVERIAPIVNRGRIVVLVKLDAGDASLRVGMSATVRFVSPTSP